MPSATGRADGTSVTSRQVERGSRIPLLELNGRQESERTAMDFEKAVVPAGAPGPASVSTRDIADPFASVDADLKTVDDLPAAEQVAVFDRIHRSLSATLATSGAGSAPVPPAGSARAGGG